MLYSRGMPKRAEYAGMTPNQVVAHNLYLARTLHGWTQEEAAKRLEPHLGQRWSKASWSAAERSVAGERRSREFTADQIYAFAKGFDLPLTFFFMPPGHDIHGRAPAIRAPGDPDGQGDSPAELLERIFEVDDAIFDRLADLFTDVIPRRHQTELQRALGDRVAKYATSVVATEIRDPATQAGNLRALADQLERASRRVVEALPDLVMPDQAVNEDPKGAA
jgi:transcriptional regulator with XRE-family HTH domain